MTCPFSGGRVRNINHLDEPVWEGLHISPRGALSQVAKLCTHLRWFAWPDKINTEPYNELPLPVTALVDCPILGGCSFFANSAAQGWEAQGAKIFAQMHNLYHLSLIALIFRAFANSMQRFSRILMLHRGLSYGTKTRSLCIGRCQRGPDIMTVLMAFAGCMDKVNLLLHFMTRHLSPQLIHITKAWAEMMLLLDSGPSCLLPSIGPEVCLCSCVGHCQ